MDIKTIKSIKRRIETPAFVYDLNQTKRILEKIKSTFYKVNKNAKIFYSYKTNVALGKAIYKMGTGLQITSLVHLKDVLKYTKGKRIIFCGRSLDDKTLKLLIKNKIFIIANSIRQVELIKNIAPGYPFGIRVDTNQVSKNKSFIASNRGLGMPLSEAKKIKTKIVGIHNHLASQNEDINSYRKNAKLVIKLAKEMNVDYINIGGGFPISYERTKMVPLEKFAQAWKSWKGKLYLEPGRFLAGPPGYLFVKIEDIINKTIIVNASLFATVRDRVLSSYAIQLPILEKGKKYYKVVGNAACSCDYFGEYHLKKVNIGDVLTFLQAGAYGISSEDFTGIEKPKEMIYINNKLKKYKQS